MDRAMELALRGTGYVRPNPLVGCVLVHDGRIIAEGWHARYGDLHAETAALAALGGPPPDGTTLYVNLEPCTHTGRQGPCADAILRHPGIRRVVVGMIDPNPLVQGRGVDRLRAGGVTVDLAEGPLAEACRWLNRVFVNDITAGRPWVIAKVAQSLDGCIATTTGHSQWITGPESRRRVHALRAMVDGVMIGVSTAVADDPALTVRDADGPSPMRIVVDPSCRLPLQTSLVRTAVAIPTAVLTRSDILGDDAARRLADAGVLVLGVDTVGPTLAPRAMLDVLRTAVGLRSVLVEGGATTLTTFLSAEAIDELHVHVAPVLLGTGLRWNGCASDELAAAPRYRIRTTDVVGDDIHVTCLRMNG